MRLALRCLLGLSLLLVLLLPSCLSSLQDQQAAALRAALRQQSQAQPYCAPTGAVSPEGWLTLEEATRLALSVGWPRSAIESGMFGAVLITESGADVDGDGRMEVDTGAANPSSSARGLMQIMTSLHGGLIERHGGDVYDAAGNLRMALDLYRQSLEARGDGWLPWEGYTLGRHTRYLDQAREAASGLLGTAQAPPSTGHRDDFTDVGRTLRDGGGDHFWYLDHNSVTASVRAPGVLAHAGRSTFRMWTKSAVEGSFTINARLRVTRMTSDNNLGGNSTDPGVKIMVKQPGPGDGSGPAAARGSGGSRDASVGNYQTPVSSFHGHTYVSKRPIGGTSGDYSFADASWGGHRGAAEGEWADVTVQVEQQPEGVRITYWINGEQIATRLDTDSPMRGPYYVGVRSDGVAWEVDHFEVIGGVVEPTTTCAPTTTLVSQVSAEGLACPVPGGSFTNDWGIPRSGGRTHQGNDVFAPTGSPAVAIEDGVIDRGNYTPRGLGGITLWLSGDSGTRYYYAHNAYNVAAIGQRVRAGEVIAAVGRTGNAASTPPHVHFEVHPGGGRAVNPYPLLTSICA